MRSDPLDQVTVIITYCKFIIFVCHKTCENGENVQLFFTHVTHFLQFKKFLFANNYGYNFCSLDILPSESDHEKVKITSLQKLPNIQYIYSKTYL